MPDRIPRNEILIGDAFNELKKIPDESVHSIITSPPYFNLRNYGEEGQVGIEKTPELYIERLVGIFREARRVLRKDGTFWLNLGDTYNAVHTGLQSKSRTSYSGNKFSESSNGVARTRFKDLPKKSLLGIPWRTALSLQADGWILRQDIIWNKQNVRPQRIWDRCLTSHEYLFLFSKTPKYYFDFKAIREPAITIHKYEKKNPKTADRIRYPELRLKRSVWTLPNQPFCGAHFAPFPPGLIKPCILASTPEKGVCDTCRAPLKINSITNNLEKSCKHEVVGVCPAIVLDPFFGSGTTGLVSNQLGRDYIGIEISPKYAKLAERRIEANSIKAPIRELNLPYR